MNKALLILLLFCPTLVIAEAYLCTASSYAGVLQKDRQFKSVAHDNVSSIKYTISKSLDTWKLKRMGDDVDILDKCPTSQYCISSRGYAGVFIRSNNGSFTVSWMQETDDGWFGNYVAKGLCTDI